MWILFYRSYWLLVLFFHRVVALWPFDHIFFLRYVSVHLFLDRQCPVVYHHVCMQCMVLADKYSVAPEGMLLVHKGCVFRQA